MLPCVFTDQGARIRAGYVAKAQSEKGSTADALERKRGELAEAEAEEERLEEAYDAAKKQRQSRRAAQQSMRASLLTALFAAIETRRIAVEKLADGHHTLLGEIRKLAGFLEDIIGESVPAEDSPAAEYIKWRDGNDGSHMEIEDRIAALTEKTSSQDADDIQYADTFEILDSQEKAVVRSQRAWLLTSVQCALIPARLYRPILRAGYQGAGGPAHALPGYPAQQRE